MLDAARADQALSGREMVKFTQGSIEGHFCQSTATSGSLYDLVFANASLHWCEGEAPALMARMLARVRPGGSLAVQMPDNRLQPSHMILREVAAEAGLSAEEVARVPSSRHSPSDHEDALLGPHCQSLDMWSTTYVQRLQGEDAVFRYVSSTAMRPLLAAFGGPETERAKEFKETCASFGEPTRDGVPLVSRAQHPCRAPSRCHPEAPGVARPSPHTSARTDATQRLRVRASLSPLLSSHLSLRCSRMRHPPLRSASRRGGISAVTQWEDHPLSPHALLGSEAPFATGSVRRIRRISRPSAHQGLEELRRHDARARAAAGGPEGAPWLGKWRAQASRALRSILRDRHAPCNGMPAGQGGKVPPFAWRVCRHLQRYRTAEHT